MVGVATATHTIGSGERATIERCAGGNNVAGGGAKPAAAVPLTPGDAPLMRLGDDTLLGVAAIWQKN